MTEIDVSGCEGYKDKHCRYETSIMFTEGNLCSKFPNCYYKQLKRLEFENKELGKIINCKNGTIASLAKIRDELKQENAKLKEKLEKIKHIMNVLNNVGYYKDLEKTVLQIIKGAEDEND